MGATAAELLNEEKTNIALGYTNGKINQVSIDEAVSMNSDFNEDLYRLANKLSK